MKLIYKFQELIVKIYGMGKNNSGSTPLTSPHEDQHTPSIRITTQTQREAIQEVIQKVESKREKTRQTCITSTI